MDDLVVQYIADNHAREAQAKLQLGSKPLVTRPLYLVIKRSHPDAQGIIDRFNAQLRGMIADRTYHRLLHVDWIQADVDGDGLFEYIPENDTKGVTEPTRAYSIFSPKEACRGHPSGGRVDKAPVLRRRQRLSRLGIGAQQLQGGGQHATAAFACHGEPVQVRLVTPARSIGGRSECRNAGCRDAEWPPAGRRPSFSSRPVSHQA